MSRHVAVMADPGRAWPNGAEAQLQRGKWPRLIYGRIRLLGVPMSLQERSAQMPGPFRMLPQPNKHDEHPLLGPNISSLGSVCALMNIAPRVPENVPVRG